MNQLRNQQIESVVQEYFHGLRDMNATLVRFAELGITGEFNNKVFDGYDHKELVFIKIRRLNNASF